jgi:polyadenylate-binding protein
MLVVPFDRNIIKATNSNVFVKNLDGGMTNKELYEIFRPYGEIFSVKLAQDYKGVSKGYGYIQYYNPEDATKAIEAMNDKELAGKNLIVDIYKANTRHDRDSQRFTNVFVKNLPPHIQTSEDLGKLFKEFGERTSVGIFSQEYKGKVGYYGFVNFAKPEDAAKAVAAMNNKEIDGTTLFVTRALTKDQREREKIKRKIELRNQSRKFTLHIKSTKGEPLTEEMVLNELSSFGEIKSIAVQKSKMLDGTETNTAIGYAVFARSEDAEQAANDYRKDGPLVINLLEGKEQRREKMKHMLNLGRIEYGSIPPYLMRGISQGMKRMPRAAGRGRGRGGNMQRPMQRPMMRPMIPGFTIPGRIPMPMMPGPYPGYMPGAPFAVTGQIGPMPGGMPGAPGAMPGGMPGMQPRMHPMPGMPPNIPPGAMIPPQMMHQMAPQFMMPAQQPQANAEIDREDLGEKLYLKIEQMIDPE